MNNLNIPIYRAKKLDCDEYVIGYHCNVCQLDFIISDDALKGFDSDNNRVLFGSCESGVVEIDKSTLAINFPDMLDSQENKIFASLSEDGKGGDITKTKNGYNIYKRVHLFFNDGTKGSKDLDIIESILKRYNGVLDIEVIGIQK